MIDLRYVKKLIEMIDESTVDSIEIATEKGIKIRISKTPTQRGGVTVAAPVMPAALPQQLMESRTTPTPGMPVQAAESSSAPREASGGSMLEVKSPMSKTSTFCAAPDLRTLAPCGC